MSLSLYRADRGALKHSGSSPPSLPALGFACAFHSPTRTPSSVSVTRREDRMIVFYAREIEGSHACSFDTGYSELKWC